VTSSNRTHVAGYLFEAAVHSDGPLGFQHPLDSGGPEVED
jgi:hypothetical protein